MRRANLATALLVGLALATLAITLLPAEVWRAPVNDAVYRGFDRNLIYTTGEVRVSRGAIDAIAPADSVTSVNLATTLRQRLAASVDVTVLENHALQPLRIGVWSPWTGSGYFLTFGPSPDYSINLGLVTDATPEATLIGGTVTSVAVARYQPGSTYRVAFVIDRAAKNIRATLSGNGIDVADSLTASQMPALFDNVQLSFTASAFAGTGTARFILRDYTLTLPHERSWAAKVDDSRVRILAIGLAVMGLIAIAFAAMSRWPRTFSLAKRRLPTRPSWLMAGAGVLYLAGNAALFPLGSHPFDFANEEFYSYVARAYSPVQLYFLPDVTSLAAIWGGIPWVQASFPYEPVIAYLFSFTGWLGSFLFGATFGTSSAALGYVIKSVNVGFGLADGILIYMVLRELNVNERWSKIGASIWIFNPAVWFSMSIWGQTHVISIFFVLLCVLFAQRRLPLWSWLALFAACLTRPQMVVFGLLLGVVLLRKFDWRENLVALSLTVIATFVALVPLTLATSPSLPVDILLNNFHIQEAGGNQATLTTVSQDAYSIWPLVTYFFRGAYSLHRAFTPSSAILFGSVTYQRASQVATVAAELAVTVGLLLRKRSALDAGGYLPLVAVGVMSFLLLLTGIVATHFLLALPILLLCRKWMDNIAYCYVVTVWSISTFVPMFGDLGVAISGHGYPLLAPEHNFLTQFVVNLYAWDRFITVAIVANICAVIWLAFLSFQPETRREALATTPS